MGLIAPNSITKKETLKFDKRILDQALANVAAETFTDNEGVIRTTADRLARRLWNTALYAESDKDATTAAKIILERMNGKPSVIVDEEKEEMPEIVLRVNPKDKAQVEALAQRTDLELDEKNDDKIIVSIEGEEGTMEF